MTLKNKQDMQKQTKNILWYCLMFQANTKHEFRDVSALYIKKLWYYHLILSLCHGPATVLFKGRQISCSWKQTKKYKASCKKIKACFTIFPRLPHSSFKVMASFVPPSDVMQSSDMLDCCTFILLWAPELWSSYKVIVGLTVASLTSLGGLI